MIRTIGLAALLLSFSGSPGLALAQSPEAATPAPAPAPTAGQVEGQTPTPAPSPAVRPRRTPPPAPAAPTPTPVPDLSRDTEYGTILDEWTGPCATRRREPRVRVGQGFTVARGEVADDVAAIFGDLLIEGTVCGDSSVVLGNARLAKGASVRGTLVVVGGTLDVEPDAAVLGELVLVGGQLRAPEGFRAERGHVIVGLPVLGDSIRGAVPYVMRGLTLGRLIVPDLLWVWLVVGITLFVYLVCNLLFPQATGSAASVIAERPLSTFAAGVLALLLTGPLVALLAVTVIGLVLIPVVGMMLVVGWIVGKIAVCRWIGGRIVPEDDPADRIQSTRSLLIGFAILTVAYMIPFLALVVWALTGVLGIGSVSIAFVRAFRRENPPPPPTVSDVPPVPPAVPHQAHGTSDPYGAPPPLSFQSQEPGAASSPGSPSAPGYGFTPRPDTRALLGFPRAAFLERAGAFAVDAAVVAIVHEALGWHRDNFYVVLLVAYHVAFWVWKQTTLGGVILRLRVARIDGGPIRVVDALVRGVTAIFSLLLFGIGALWILRDPERQAWHDMVAGTYVVRVPRGYPLP